MTTIGCADAKDLLPELIRHELDERDREAVAAHVASCEACSDEVEFLRTIQAAAVDVPASLAADIKSAVAAGMRPDARVSYRRRRRLTSRWLAAAATVVLALGTAVIWQRTQALPEVGPLGQDPFAVVWPSDDGDVAGVPMLADLSDEELEILLEELGG